MGTQLRNARIHLEQMNSEERGGGGGGGGECGSVYTPFRTLTAFLLPLRDIMWASCTACAEIHLVTFSLLSPMYVL